MPGKAQVSLERYFEAFAAAVPVFGRGQVSTYILAGLGDSQEAILDDLPRRLIALGVYPFVVPFVPISGTPLESHPPPSPAFMHESCGPLAQMLRDGGLRSERHQGRLRQMRRLLGAFDLRDGGSPRMIFEPVHAVSRQRVSA